jgi:hypothetical protein
MKKTAREKRMACWSSNPDWVARAEAHDAWRAEIKQEEAGRLVKEDAKEWARRARDLRERKYAPGQTWLATSETLILPPFPSVVRREGEEGCLINCPTRRVVRSLPSQRLIARLKGFSGSVGGGNGPSGRVWIDISDHASGAVHRVSSERRPPFWGLWVLRARRDLTSKEKL